MEPKHTYHHASISSTCWMKCPVFFHTFLQKLPSRNPLLQTGNQSNCNHPTTCSFNGKATLEGNRTPIKEKDFSEERDEETGYGYFGARYMDHELMTMWLSVDPMSDKYPSISPYAYCAWNPVIYIDSNGMDYSDQPPIGRYILGGLNIAGGVLTIAGGVVIGTGGSVITGGAAAPIGFIVVSSGAYEVVEGLHRITNTISGVPSTSDPQYTTPLGAATDNNTIDAATTVVIGAGSTLVTAANEASAAANAIQTIQDGVRSVSKASGKVKKMLIGISVTTGDVIAPFLMQSSSRTCQSQDGATSQTSPSGSSGNQPSDVFGTPFYEW